MTPTITPKQQRKQALQRRQTMIYGALLVGMSAVGVGSFLVATGTIQGPFDVGFTGEERPYPGAVVPCPPQDATALPYGEITVNVYNGSPLTGLATLVSSNLEGRGFTVEQYGNYIEESYPGTVLVQSGLEGVRAAYTVAQLFDEPVINVDARPGATVEIVLGKKITSMNDVASPTAESTPPPLQPARGCVPFESLTAEKLPPIRVLTAIQPSETATPAETTKAE